MPALPTPKRRPPFEATRTNPGGKAALPNSQGMSNSPSLVGVTAVPVVEMSMNVPGSELTMRNSDRAVPTSDAATRTEIGSPRKRGERTGFVGCMAAGGHP